MISVNPIPAFSDNYIWCISDENNHAWVVDPGDSNPVVQYLAKHRLELKGIILTHHHFDHTGGVNELLKQSDLPVYGYAGARIPSVNTPLNEGDQITVSGQTLSVIEVPGHTLDHIAFFGELDGKPSLFCGDTLFAAGCGRLFEGTPQVMFNSLSKLKQLPDATHIYCAHEYTLANLKFAEAAMPGNSYVSRRIQDCSTLRKNNKPTLPSTIEIEKQTNPFIRAGEDEELRASIASALGETPEQAVDIFTALRAWKDRF